METCKPTSTPFDAKTPHLLHMFELTKKESREMVRIPYKQTIGNIMYVMIVVTK